MLRQSEFLGSGLQLGCSVVGESFENRLNGDKLDLIVPLVVIDQLLQFRKTALFTGFTPGLEKFQHDYLAAILLEIDARDSFIHDETRFSFGEIDPVVGVERRCDFSFDPFLLGKGDGPG